ncbi:type II secretion system F family protein [Bacillus sp. FJAT-27445]|uniref:type II secretion system F family protein n=1 Tax=Bacillus sp. FJAT-27445 TaxID=1679166 RepID=UPI0007436109|nr:type II secretion system F family protein [Bacillus sp. FJAT-27445]
MDSFILFSVMLFLLFLLLSLVNWYQYIKAKEKLSSHLNEIVAASSFIKLKKDTFTDRSIKFLARYADDLSSIGERINFFSESEEVKDLLMKAGNPYEMSVARFQGFKIVCIILGFIIGALMVVIGFPLANIAFVVLPVAGFFLPILVIRSMARKRQEQLRRDLPDFLDTVSISLQAGSSLDGALKEVLKYFSGPIRDEFTKFIQEIELGVPREIAYQHLQSRNDNEEFQSFIKSLIQATRLGVPIAATFKDQAEEIRRISLEQVKEQAAKASPKVTLITSFLIAPLIMLMIIGLVVLNMIYGENSLFNFFTES